MYPLKLRCVPEKPDYGQEVKIVWDNYQYYDELTLITQDGVSHCVTGTSSYPAEEKDFEVIISPRMFTPQELVIKVKPIYLCVYDAAGDNFFLYYIDGNKNSRGISIEKVSNLSKELDDQRYKVANLLALDSSDKAYKCITAYHKETYKLIFKKSESLVLQSSYLAPDGKKREVDKKEITITPTNLQIEDFKIELLAQEVGRDRYTASWKAGKFQDKENYSFVLYLYGRSVPGQPISVNDFNKLSKAEKQNYRVKIDTISKPFDTRIYLHPELQLTASEFLILEAYDDDDNFLTQQSFDLTKAIDYSVRKKDFSLPNVEFMVYESDAKSAHLLSINSQNHTGAVLNKMSLDKSPYLIPLKTELKLPGNNMAFPHDLAKIISPNNCDFLYVHWFYQIWQINKTNYNYSQADISFVNSSFRDIFKTVVGNIYDMVLNGNRMFVGTDGMVASFDISQKLSEQHWIFTMMQPVSRVKISLGNSTSVDTIETCSYSNQETNFSSLVAKDGIIYGVQNKRLSPSENQAQNFIKIIDNRITLYQFAKLDAFTKTDATDSPQNSLLAAHPELNILFFLNAKAKEVSILDAETLLELYSVKLDSKPIKQIFEPVSNKLYVLNAFSKEGSTITIIKDIKMQSALIESIVPVPCTQNDYANLSIEPKTNNILLTTSSGVYVIADNNLSGSVAASISSIGGFKSEAVAGIYASSFLAAAADDDYEPASNVSTPNLDWEKLFSAPQFEFVDSVIKWKLDKVSFDNLNKSSELKILLTLPGGVQRTLYGCEGEFPSELPAIEFLTGETEDFDMGKLKILMPKPPGYLFYNKNLTWFLYYIDSSYGGYFSANVNGDPYPGIYPPNRGGITIEDVSKDLPSALNALKQKINGNFAKISSLQKKEILQLVAEYDERNGLELAEGVDSSFKLTIAHLTKEKTITIKVDSSTPKLTNIKIDGANFETEIDGNLCVSWDALFFKKGTKFKVGFGGVPAYFDGDIDYVNRIHYKRKIEEGEKNLLPLAENGRHFTVLAKLGQEDIAIEKSPEYTFTQKYGLWNLNLGKEGAPYSFNASVYIQDSSSQSYYAFDCSSSNPKIYLYKNPTEVETIPQILIIDKSILNLRDNVSKKLVFDSKYNLLLVNYDGKLLVVAGDLSHYKILNLGTIFNDIFHNQDGSPPNDYIYDIAVYQNKLFLSANGFIAFCDLEHFSELKIDYQKMNWNFCITVSNFNGHCYTNFNVLDDNLYAIQTLKNLGAKEGENKLFCFSKNQLVSLKSGEFAPNGTMCGSHACVYYLEFMGREQPTLNKLSFNEEKSESIQLKDENPLKILFNSVTRKVYLLQQSKKINKVTVRIYDEDLVELATILILENFPEPSIRVDSCSLSLNPLSGDICINILDLNFLIMDTQVLNANLIINKKAHPKYSCNWPSISQYGRPHRDAITHLISSASTSAATSSSSGASISSCAASIGFLSHSRSSFEEKDSSSSTLSFGK